MQNDNQWLIDKLATIKPAWTPNPAPAREALFARLEKPEARRAWLPLVGVVAAAFTLFAIFNGRALAQDLWFYLFLNRIDVVRLDASRLPFDTHVSSNPRVQAVEDLDQAGAKAGFWPKFPTLDTLDGKPLIGVIGQMTVQQQIDVPRLESALKLAGAGDVKVPAQWQGLTLSMKVGPLVEMNYKGQVEVLQARPFELRIPNGFPLATFAELALRAAGVSWWEARALAERFAANPAWLLDIPTEEAALVQEIQLRSGKALIVEDRSAHSTVERVTLLFHTADRVYSISAPNRELCVQVANSLL